MKTYRFRAHSMFDPDLYRDKAEVENWTERDPLKRFREWLLATGQLHEPEIAAVQTEIEAEVEAAVQFAEAAPWEAEGDLLRDVGAAS